MIPTIPTRRLMIEDDCLSLLFLLSLSGSRSISHLLPVDPELQVHTPALVHCPFSHGGLQMAGWTEQHWVVMTQSCRWDILWYILTYRCREYKAVCYDCTHNWIYIISYLRTIITTASSPSIVTSTHICACAATIKAPLTACGCVILHFA